MAESHPYPSVPEEHRALLTYNGHTYRGLGRLQLKGRDYDDTLIHTGEFNSSLSELGVASEQ